MKTSAAFAAGLLGAAVAGWASAASADSFSPQAVFALPDHQFIDDRCKDARDFADLVARDYSRVDALAAAGAERAFVACAKLPRLNPDLDQQRYLILAAATAAFVVGSKTSGDDSEEAYHAADRLAAQLGGDTPEVNYRIVTVDQGNAGQAGAPPSGSNAPGPRNGPPRKNQEVVRDALGRGHGLKFSDVATKLRQAVADALAATSSPPPGKPGT